MNKAAINVIGYKNCCSCGLCENSCPFEAINMEFDPNGFYKPNVAPEKCTNCGVCARTCPIIKNEVLQSQQANPKFLGGWNDDLENVMQSSSGGIFYVLSKEFIQNTGGVVCGVRWEDGVPTYDMAETVEQLEAFRGSKYLQARTGRIFIRVKDEIRNGRQVLFFGVPCQIQAITNYIQSENLYCVDLVCAGVPSMLMYHKYCEETFGKSSITHVNFRAKELGKPAPWRRYSLEFYSKEYLLKREYHGDNPFFTAFNSTLTYNRACYSCSFNTLPRRGDLTLCDYWGVPTELENPMGTSLILVNNERGESLLKNFIKKKPMAISIIEAPRTRALEGTKRINMANRYLPDAYEETFRTLRNKGFYAMYRKFIRPTLFIRILRRLGLTINH